VAMEGGAIKLFDVRSYDKVSNLFALSLWDSGIVGRLHLVANSNVK